MYVKYRKELSVQQALEANGFRTFIPMEEYFVKRGASVRRETRPAIHNLIFVHASQEKLTSLKMYQKEFEPMRYMMKTSGDGHTEILHVPDRQMENFMRVASAQDESIIFLDVRDSANMGRRVRITAGRFKGVEGVIKRIRKNKYFLIQIDGVAAVAITYVPADCLEPV